MNGVHDMGGMDGFGKVEPESNEPMFHAKWESRVLAMVRALGAAGDPDTGETYYRHWLATLEGLVARKGVASEAVLRRCRDALHRAADRTPHGSPIELRPEDFRSES